MIDSLYKEELLEHYQNPRNFGKPSQFDISSSQHNPFCGDEIELYVQFEKEGSKNEKIKTISFVGRGCAISIASTSILTEFCKKKTKTQLTKFTQEDMLRLLQIEVSENRKKCALLGFSVLKDCLG